MAFMVTLFVDVRILSQIVVKNVPVDITLRQLEEYFTKFGKVETIKTSSHAGTTRTDAVVTYFNREAARHANRVLTAVLLGSGPSERGRMQTGTKRTGQSSGGDQSPRGASIDASSQRDSKRARQAINTEITPPTSPPTSPALGYVGNQAVAWHGVPSPSRITDSIMGLCHLAADGRVIV